MCGIVGFYSPSGRLNPNAAWVREALYAGTLRGNHGTGFVTIHEKSGEVSMHKRAMPGYDFLDLRATDTALSDMAWIKCFIGHNRQKTFGSISAENTHPFEDGNIWLVHNGTVQTHNLKSNHAVDSAQIAHALSTEPVEDVIKKLIGAFALVWWDKSADSMHAIRNEQRPLWFGKDKNHNSVYFTSEPGMLKWLCERNGIELEEMYQPTPGTLLTFSGKSVVPEKRSLKLWEPAPTPTNHKNFGDHYNNRKYGAPVWTDTLKKSGLLMGSEVIVHPVSWSTHEKGRPHKNTNGCLYLMSVTNKDAPMFRFSPVKFMSLDASKSYKARVTGTVVSNGTEFIVVSNLLSDGENEFGLDDATVYLRQAAFTLAKLPIPLPSPANKSKKDNSALMPGPSNKLIEESEYSRLIRHGCSWCGCTLDIETADKHTFDRHGNVFCEDCSDVEEVKEFIGANS